MKMINPIRYHKIFALSVVGLIVLLALYGNIADILVYSSWSNGKDVTMKFATMLCFLISIAYYLGKEQMKWIFVMVALDCLIAHYILGQQPILKGLHDNGINSVAYNIPSLVTLLCFGLLFFKKWGYLVAVFAFVAFLGHATGVEEMTYYFEGISTGMASGTALGLLMLAGVCEAEKIKDERDI